MRLSQVLSNLLNNASKFSPRQARIELRLLRDDDEAVVRVRDHGVGIPVPMLEKIFEPFTQVDPVRDQTPGGLGIGLALVRRFVEMHGGSVEARSPGKDQGAEFLVRLPLIRQSVADPVFAAAAAPSRSGMRRILVVDDNVDAAASLAALLRLDGHEVHLAADGLEAVESAGQLRPDVVLLDIGMPRMDGFEAARRIRGLDFGAEALLVAVTGWGQQEDRARTREAGFDAHCVKPIQYEELRRLLATART